MARTRSVTRTIMNRAWAIAKNAMNAHNSNVDRIAQNGASLSVTEFIAEAMKLAWREERTGKTLYQKVAGIPRKVMPRIHAELKRAQRTNPNISFYELVMVALTARYGSTDKVPSGVADSVFQGELAVSA
tara:strand:+ start:136 stop:525 length:390 start_codon:yes stop_codon:yes gene_type:complete